MHDYLFILPSPLSPLPTPFSLLPSPLSPTPYTLITKNR
ncbi:hypothetical protein amyaer_0132 [Microcystis aeruginosa NIES-2481]|nr:hypothetical protein amyaer_0132 [Microcystis aeruginosa NIES-2481]